MYFLSLFGMHTIFLSYRFTGEDPSELDFILSNMKSSLESVGHAVVCSFYLENFFKQNRFDTDQIYTYMLERQRECGVFMAFIKSEAKSKGMILESNRAVELKQRYVLVHKKGLYLPEFHERAPEKIEFFNYSELFNSLKKFH